jgi:hypothetical protein
MSDMITMVVGYYHGIYFADIKAVGGKSYFSLFPVYPGIKKQFNAVRLNINAVAVAARLKCYRCNIHG